MSISSEVPISLIKHILYDNDSIGAKKIDFLSQKPKTKLSYSLYRKTMKFYEKKSVFIL